MYLLWPFFELLFASCHQRVIMDNFENNIQINLIYLLVGCVFMKHFKKIKIAPNQANICIEKSE